MHKVLDYIKKIDYILLIAPLCLGALSVLMIDSITSNYVTYPRQVTVQIIAFCAGFVLMIMALMIDPSFISRLHWVLYALALIMQLVVFIPGLSVGEGTSRAWINLGFTTLQPSEFVKVAFVLAFAGFLERYRHILSTFWGFLITFAYALPVVGLVAYIDLGAGIVVAVMFVGMLFAAGIKRSLFAKLAIAFVIAMPIGYRFLSDYQKLRFTAFMHPDDTSIEATYQIMQSKVAIGSGGLFGKGLGHGTIKESGFLPVQESDFIYAIICEELGFVGGLAVILVFVIMLIRMWRGIVATRKVYGALVYIGFMCMFGFQVFENIGMTMGLMPVTGITLPFLSAGGSSVMANMLAVGFCLGVGMRTKERTYKHISTKTAAEMEQPKSGWTEA